jgi:hypothetical protein
VLRERDTSAHAVAAQLGDCTHQRALFLKRREKK